MLTAGSRRQDAPNSEGNNARRGGSGNDAP